MELAAAKGSKRRLRASQSKLLLIFTPDLAESDPLAALEAALPWVDIVQVRPKPLAQPGEEASRGAATTQARLAFEWCERVLALRGSLGSESAPLVMVNDLSLIHI